MHPVLASETGWRMKPLGEAIGPVEAHRRGLVLTRSVQRVGVALKPWVFSQSMT